VVQDELAPSLEKVEQRRLSVGPIEHVLLLDADHGQAATLGRKSVVQARQLLLLREQRFARSLPFGSRHDSWQRFSGRSGHG
jgi:hypothetical protein